LLSMTRCDERRAGAKTTNNSKVEL